MTVTVLETVYREAGDDECVERKASNIDDPPFWLFSQIRHKQFVVLVTLKNSIKQSNLSTILKRLNNINNDINAFGGQIIVICESERREILGLYYSLKLDITAIAETPSSSSSSSQNNNDHNIRQSWKTYDSVISGQTSTNDESMGHLLERLTNDGRSEISGACAGIIALTNTGEIIYSNVVKNKFGINNSAKKFVDHAWESVSQWCQDNAGDKDAHSHPEADPVEPASPNVRQKIDWFEKLPQERQSSTKQQQDVKYPQRKRQPIGRTPSKSILGGLLGQSTKLDRILANKKSRQCLREFLAKEFNTELIEYLDDLQEISFNNATTYAPKLYETYIAPNSKKQLNLSGTMVKQLQTALENESHDQVLQGLSDVGLEVLQTLREDVFKRFIESPHFKDAVKVIET